MICQLFVTDCLLYKECDVGESFREPEGRFENRWLISKLHKIEKGIKTLKFSLCLMSVTRTNHPSTELQLSISADLLWFTSLLRPFLCRGGGHVGAGDVWWAWREVLHMSGSVFFLFKWRKMAITIIYLPCYAAVKVRLCSKGTQWQDLVASPHLLAANFFVSVLLVGLHTQHVIKQS